MVRLSDGSKKLLKLLAVCMDGRLNERQPTTIQPYPDPGAVVGLKLERLN